MRRCNCKWPYGILMLMGLKDVFDGRHWIKAISTTTHDQNLKASDRSKLLRRAHRGVNSPPRTGRFGKIYLVFVVIWWRRERRPMPTAGWAAVISAYGLWVDVCQNSVDLRDG